MRIQRQEMLAGIPVLGIRNFLKKNSSDWVSVPEVEGYFHLNDQETEKLFNELINRGLLERRMQKYYLTLKGKALRIARCVPPINRSKADRIFREFMQRVEEVNRDDFYLYRVSRLLLFGSYLNPENKDFGDIDIAFELEQKIADVEEFLCRNEQLVEEAIEQGSYFTSLWDEINYSRRQVLLRLKNRSPYISLHPISKDHILDLTSHKQIFPEPVS